MQEGDLLCSKGYKNTARPWFKPIYLTLYCFNTPWHGLIHVLLVLGVMSLCWLHTRILLLWVYVTHGTEQSWEVVPLFLNCLSDCALTVLFRVTACGVLLYLYLTVSKWVRNVNLHLIVQLQWKNNKDSPYWKEIHCNKLAWKRWIHCWCLLCFWLGQGCSVYISG